VYEAWSIGYERSLIAGQGYNASDVLQPIVGPRHVVHQGAPPPAVPPPTTVVSSTPLVTNTSALFTTPGPLTSRYTRPVDPSYFVQSQYVQYTSVPSTSAISTGTPYDPNYTELQRIKMATQEIPYRGVTAAVGNALHTYETIGIPGRDEAQVPIPVSSILPDEVPDRAATRSTRGVNDGKAFFRPNRRQMFPPQNQCNGESKTFENFAFNLSG
jgi:hypothetical protein